MSSDFLKQAKELVTPKREPGTKKAEEDFTPVPPSKKVCSSFEKWVKKQPGDLSLVRDTGLKALSKK